VQNPFANSLQSSNAPSINPTRPKPMNRSYSQNAPFDTMKTRHRFSPLGGCKESLFLSPDIKSIEMHQIQLWIRR
jgi:hypothetical protein